jgi:probable selenium-dependent hydroxylase accessory protein YqeC
MGSLRNALGLERGGVVAIVGAGGKTSLMFRLARELSAEGDTVLTTTTTRICMPTVEQSAEVIVAEAAEEVVSRAAGRLRHRRHITAVAGRSGDPAKRTGYPTGDIERFERSGLFRWILVEADGAAGLPLKAPAAHEPVVPACTRWLAGVVGLSALGHPLADDRVFRPGLFSSLTGLPLGEPVTAQSIVALVLQEQGLFQYAPPGARRLVFLNQADAPGGPAAARRICELLEREAGAGISRVILGRLLQAEPVAAVYLLNNDTT